MVALAILGIGLGVIFQGLSQGLRLRGAAAENVRFVLAAESILGGLSGRTGAPAAPEEGEEAGCRWRLESVERPVALGAVVGTGTGQGQGGAELVEILLTITAPSGQTWELSTLLPRAAEGTP